MSAPVIIGAGVGVGILLSIMQKQAEPVTPQEVSGESIDPATASSSVSADPATEPSGVTGQTMVLSSDALSALDSPPPPPPPSSGGGAMMPDLGPGPSEPPPPPPPPPWWAQIATLTRKAQEKERQDMGIVF